MSEMDDDESTLKTLVKLTAESKLLYQPHLKCEGPDASSISLRWA